MKDFYTRPTKTFRAVDANMVLTECCESDCRIPIMVEKDEQKDENRCTSCLMKHRLKAGLNT